MMLSFAAFVLMLALLLGEGWLLLRAFFPTSDRLLKIALLLPAATVSNVLLVFVLTLLHVPLSLITLVPAHAMIMVALWVAARITVRAPAMSSASPTAEIWTMKKKILAVICSLFLTNAFIFSVVHALVLPSLSIDVFTNWTMRSQVSWSDSTIAFDRTEDRGIAKPQYPFLVHALQITANEGQKSWNDRIANFITWLLTISSFAAAFLILRKLRGTLTALAALTGMTMIPLLVIHLAAGYGDIHLTTYGLLSFLALAAALEEKNARWMVLSVLMMVGALWSKSEGLYFAFVPWALALLWLGKKKELPWKTVLLSIAVPLLCFMPFLIFLIAKGLPLTPHESDGTFGLKAEGFAALPGALFGGGSLGMIWYALPIIIATLIIEKRRLSYPLLWIGILSFFGVIFIYTFTPNVAFLINGQSFYRQLLLPAVLLISWCALSLRMDVKNN